MANNVYMTMGRLAADPEEKIGKRGPFLVFTVYEKNYPEEDMRQDCVFYGSADEIARIKKHFKVGSRVKLTGHLQGRTFQNREGQTIFKKDMVVYNVDFWDSGIGKPSEDGAAKTAAPAPAPTQAPTQPAPAEVPKQPDMGGYDDFPDDW